MEVSGKMSEAEGDLYCLPCSVDNITEPVYGYCQNCQEHLCNSCCKHHRRSRATRDHVLLNEDAMPKVQTVPTYTSTDEVDFCSGHLDKKLEFHCKKHNVIACYVCMTLGHKSCEVEYIPDVSGNIGESEEFGELLAQLKDLKEKCHAKLTRIESSIAKVHLCRDEVMEAMNLFRKEINVRLDKMQSEMTKEIELLVSTAESKLSSVSDTCAEIADEVGDREASLNKLKEDHQHNKLFVEMKRAEKILSSLNNKAKQIVENQEMHDRLEFIHNHKIFELLKAETLGKIETSSFPSEDKPVTLKLIGTIDVKSSSDRERCDVSGIALIPPKHIIVADYSNSCIKLIEMENQTLVSEMKLSSSPYDVICLPKNKLAIALHNAKCIQVMSLNGSTLLSDRRIDVGEKCHGLAFCQDKLVVVCNYLPGKIVIINLVSGKKLGIFDLPDLFRGPEKVVVSRDEKNICVTDWYTGKLLKIDWEGNVSQTYELEACSKPCSILELEDGTFLVSCTAIDTIARVSSSGEECILTGLEEIGPFTPGAVAYCEKQRKLYVSCALRKWCPKESVKVFAVEWI